MTTPIAPSSVTSSGFPISLAALTNNFSTHLNADDYLLWRDQITPSSSAMTFMSILMALIRLLQKPFLLTTLLLQIQTTLKNMLADLRLINLLQVVLKILFRQPLARRSQVKVLPRMFRTLQKCSSISKLYLVLISCIIPFLTLTKIISLLKHTSSKLNVLQINLLPSNNQSQTMNQ